MFAGDLKGEASTPILIDVQKQKTDLWIQKSEIQNQDFKMQNMPETFCNDAIRFVHKHILLEHTLNVLFQNQNWGQHVIHIRKSIDMFLNVWLTQSRTPIKVIPELRKYFDEPTSECLPTSMASDLFQDCEEHST